MSIGLYLARIPTHSGDLVATAFSRVVNVAHSKRRVFVVVNFKLI